MNLLAIVLGIIAILAVMGSHMANRFTTMDLQMRVKKLEEASQKRIPYKVAEELLDAMAALDIERTQKHFDLDILDNVAGHVANALKVGTKRE